MLRVLLLALAACALVLATSDGTYDVHYPGRSGDAYLRATNSHKINECALIQVAGASAFHGDAIEDVRVADLFAHVIGSPSVGGSSSADYSPVGLFSRPRALALIFVDGVSPATAATELPFVAGHSAVTVATTSKPQNSAVTRLTTIMTGTSPSAHGIVGSEWPAADGSVVSAYGRDGKSMAGYNLPQAVEAAFEGHSLAVAVSASYQHSAALVPSGRMPAKGSRIWAWYEDGAASSADDSCSDVAVSRADVVAAIAADAELSSVFSADIAADRILVAELMLVERVSTLLATGDKAALLADASPDVIAVSFSALPAVEAAHGAASQQLAVARRLVSAAAARLLAVVSAGTHQRAAAAAVVFRAAAPLPAASLPRQLLERLSSAAIAGWERFLPAVYLAETARADPLACSQLSAAAADAAEVAVECSMSSAIRHVRLMYARQDFGNSSGNHTSHNKTSHTLPPTDEQITNFQLALWVGIILSAAVFVAAWFVFFLRYTDDRMVFKHEPWMKNPWD